MSENYSPNTINPDGADLPHMFRYYFARGFVEPGDTVLDAACGWGYGSNILSKSAQRVIGLDYREDCINHNVRAYDQWFLQTNLNEVVALPECDLAVSIETIEHLKEPQRFANMLKEAAQRGVVLTTPIIPTMHGNPDHLHDFTVDQIVELFRDKQWRLFHHAIHGGIYGMFYFEKIANKVLDNI